MNIEHKGETDEGRFRDLRNEDGSKERSRWVRVGVAFPHRDGSLNVLLDAIPLSGRLQIRDRAEPQNGKERPR